MTDLLEMLIKSVLNNIHDSGLLLPLLFLIAAKTLVVSVCKDYVGYLNPTRTGKPNTWQSDKFDLGIAQEPVDVCYDLVESLRILLISK